MPPHPAPWKAEFNEYGGYDCMGSGTHIRDANGELLFTIDTSEEEQKIIAAQVLNSVNALAGLNPAAVAQVVEALQSCLQWILLGNHEEAPGWIEARNKAQAALQALQQEEP